MPEVGVEPTRITPQVPETCVSANSTIRAFYQKPFLIGYFLAFQESIPPFTETA